MTWSDLLTAVRQAVFPEDEAINLVPVHNNWVLDGLIDLQRRASSLQGRNFKLLPFDQTLFKCGATIVDKPDGQVSGVYTYTSDDHCDPVYYLPVDRRLLEQLQADVQSCGSGLTRPLGGETVNGIFIPFDPLPLGRYHAEATTDKGWRAARGVFAIVEDELWLFPHIESTERVAIEWKGIKVEYDDGDLVSEKVSSRPVVECLEWYLRMSAAGIEDRDVDDYTKFQALYESKRRDLILEERAKLEAPDRRVTPTICAPWQLAVKRTDMETLESYVSFVAFGDSGAPTGPAGDPYRDTKRVRDLVNQLDPDFVLHLGDVASTGYPGTLSAALLTPYAGWVPSYWKQVIGNHDVQTDGGAMLTAALPDLEAAGGTGFYYKFTVGPVDVFVCYTGSTGTAEITPGCAQAKWLEEQLKASAAAWKVVAMHKPQAGYTSDAAHQGDADLPAGLDLAGWGADLVLAGHGHFYERIERDGLTRITAGTGGAAIGTAGTVAAGSEKRLFEFGASRITVNSTRLLASFYSADGRILDTVLKEKAK